MRPDSFEKYPQMVYRAEKVNGKNVCGMPEPLRETFKTDEHWRRACEMTDQANRRRQRTVNNEEEYEAARRDGYRDSQAEAIAFLNGLDDDVAKAAAHRHYEDRNMSPQAKAEAEKVDAESYEHQPEIQAQPIKRRPGRPRKSDAA